MPLWNKQQIENFINGETRKIYNRNMRRESMSEMKPIRWIIFTMVVCVVVGICAHIYDEKVNGNQIMFPDDSRTIIAEYHDEIQFIEDYTGMTINELNHETVHYIRTTILEIELDKRNTDLRFIDLENDIVDACLKFKSYKMNSNVLDKG